MRIHCVIAKSDISTHALTEGDMFLLYNLVMEVIFQLTPSRRATNDAISCPVG